MTSGGSGSSPGMFQTNIPSPATFATMAAAVGVQNPLEDTNDRPSGSTTEKGRDPYAELVSNVEAFLNVQLAQLESAGNIFFDL
ncbi:hypothetical protein CBS101457_004504 [Exobasidium rhododendri]|nr:hypothetical protein CBS101457_004504 [Exobasidium rhododendri]